MCNVKPKESRKQINAWVAKATRNLITEVLNPEDDNPSTVHVVANAIYFKGEWRDPFDKEDTVDLLSNLLLPCVNARQGKIAPKRLPAVVL